MFSVSYDVNMCEGLLRKRMRFHSYGLKATAFKVMETSADEFQQCWNDKGQHFFSFYKAI